MSGNFEGNDLDQMNRWVQNAPENEGVTGSGEGKNFKAGKTAKWMAIWGLATAIGVGGVGSFEYAKAAWDAGKPTIKGETSLSDAGTGKVESIDMTVKPVTVTTIDTEVTGTKTEFQDNIDTGKYLLNLKFSVGHRDITRKAEVETDVQLDPQKITIEWQPPKSDAKGDDKLGQLYFEVPDAAISQESNIKLADTTDHSGSLISMSTAVGSAVASTVGGIFGTGGNEVPLIGKMSSNQISIDNGLENFSDLATKVNVGKVCTAAVMQAPNYTNDLKANVVPVAKGIMLSTDTDVQSQLTKGLGDMHKTLLKSADPITAEQTLVSHAIVLLPGETTANPDAPTTMKIPDDKADIDQLNNYIKSKDLSVQAASADTLKCDASDAKLIENTQPNDGATPAPTVAPTTAPTASAEGSN